MDVSKRLEHAGCTILCIPIQPHAGIDSSLPDTHTHKQNKATWAGPKGAALKAKMHDLLREEVHHHHFVHAHTHGMDWLQTEYNKLNTTRRRLSYHSCLTHTHTHSKREAVEVVRVP